MRRADPRGRGFESRLSPGGNRHGHELPLSGDEVLESVRVCFAMSAFAVSTTSFSTPLCDSRGFTMAAGGTSLSAQFSSHAREVDVDRRLGGMENWCSVCLARSYSLQHTEK